MSLYTVTEPCVIGQLHYATVPSQPIEVDDELAARHDRERGELELTRSISLRQLAPQSLLVLRITGSCTVDLPEWFFDRDCPGHYLRRIKNVAVSVPALDRQDGSLNLTLTLQKSSVRVSPMVKTGPYARPMEGGRPKDDDRFIDYLGTAESIVTSSGLNGCAQRMGDRYGSYERVLNGLSRQLRQPLVIDEDLGCYAIVVPVIG